MNEAGVPGMSLAVIENNQLLSYNAYGIREKGSNKSQPEHHL